MEEAERVKRGLELCEEINRISYETWVKMTTAKAELKKLIRTDPVNAERYRETLAKIKAYEKRGL